MMHHRFRNDELDAEAEGESMILDEEIDENYEPTEEEILDYARYLGMDPAEDKDLLYIAKEGLKAPLPQAWKPIKTREGEIYYYNFDTQQSQWEHPCDEHYKKVYIEKKKAIMMKSRENKSSKARGRLADALSMQAPGADSKPAQDERLNALAQSTMQSQVLSNSQAAQKLQPKDQSGHLEASFSQDNVSFNSSSTPNKRPGGGEIRPLMNKNLKFGQVLSDVDLDDQNYSFEQDNTRLGLSNLGFDKGRNSEYVEIDEEFNQKVQDYLDDQKRELTQLELKFKREMQSKRDDHESELAKDLEGLRLKLSSGYLASQKRLNHELESVKAEIAEEIDRKYKAKERELKDRSENILKHEQQILDMEDEHEDSHFVTLKEQFVAKKSQLNDQKRELQLNVQRIKREEEKTKESVNQKMSLAFNLIEEDYSQMLKDVEADEMIKQRRELENHQKELDAKIEQEKKTILNAQKKVFSLKESKKNDLRKHYESKFEQEKQKLDEYFNVTIAALMRRKGRGKTRKLQSKSNRK